VRRCSVVAFVVVLALLILLGFVFIHICADGGAMASGYGTCDCLGFEWEAYDQTPADGSRRTLCFGIVRSRTCYQFRTGPEVSCRVGKQD
jgi:hypothetical protein